MPRWPRRSSPPPQELRAGRFDDHFPLSVWQTGSGTQTNMNANEVIANRANELLGQPLGTRSAGASQRPRQRVAVVERQLPDGDAPGGAAGARAAPAARRCCCCASGWPSAPTAFADVLKIARTHLMDAVPMTMGQAFDAFARQVGHGIERIDATLPRLCLLPQGGTAAGTGLNAPPGFDAAFCEELSALDRHGLRAQSRASSKAWPRTTRWSRSRARSTSSRRRWSRSPTTSACSARGRAAAWASS